MRMGPKVNKQINNIKKARNIENNPKKVMKFNMNPIMLPQLAMKNTSPVN
jgi:hypothetical protein